MQNEKTLKQLRKLKVVYDSICKTVSDSEELESLGFLTAGIAEGINLSLRLLGGEIIEGEFEDSEIKEDVSRILVELAQKLPKDFEEL